MKTENNFNEEQGHILFKATNIAGFGRTHVSLFVYFFVFSCLLVMSVPLQNQPRKSGLTNKYNCSLVSKCDCPVQVHIKEDKSLKLLEFNGRLTKTVTRVW